MHRPQHTLALEYSSISRRTFPSDADGYFRAFSNPRLFPYYVGCWGSLYGLTYECSVFAGFSFVCCKVMSTIFGYSYLLSNLIFVFDGNKDVSWLLHTTFIVSVLLHLPTSAVSFRFIVNISQLSLP